MFLKNNWTVEQLKAFEVGTIAQHLGIELLEIGDDYAISKMPVDHRTKQPYGLLHGGASVVLAENLGSMASALTLGIDSNEAPVGVEINANHIKAVYSGWVYGKVTPVHLGKKTHVWNIQITDEKGDLVCISRITIMIVDKK